MNLKSFDKSESKDSVVLTAQFEMPEVKAQLMLRYRINAAGEVAVTQQMTTDKEAKVADLFRYGMQLQMPASFSKLEYYGRGPEENYIDRHTPAFIGKYEANVKDEYYPYVRPQESGNHTDIRYFSIFNPTTGKGITFEGYAPMECSAIPYLVEDLDAGIEKEHAWGQHSGDLVEKGLVQLHIQQRQFGLGCIDSWGASPMEKYRMHYQDRCFSFVIKLRNKIFTHLCIHVIHRVSALLAGMQGSTFSVLWGEKFKNRLNPLLIPPFFLIFAILTKYKANIR